ncbi:MAG: protein kinase [Deltaproteobacteria bacterium]|nr:protein kinase [Deltaproteobacteria bacterium]
MSGTATGIGRYCSHCGATFTSGMEKCPRDGADILNGDRDPLLDMVVANRYEVLARLGGGGMGQVYRCRHKTLGKFFALKVLFGELAGDRRMVERFHREALAQSRLSHRNIVAVVDFGETDKGLLYLVTEFIAGRLLTDEPAQFPVPQAVHLVRQIARGLAHAHQKGLVHRDLKPDNIMLVEEDGDPLVAKLLDFGIARLVDQDTASSTQLTMAGLIMGTPEYMSPEQARGLEADRRSDLYSLGVILYELLTGGLPFQADNPMDMVTQHVMSAPAPIDAPNVPTELAALAMRLLEKKPEDRFDDAEKFLSALEEAAAAAEKPSERDAREHGDEVTPPPAEADAATEPPQVPAQPLLAARSELVSSDPPAPPVETVAPESVPTEEVQEGDWRAGEAIDGRWEVFGWAKGSSGPVHLVRDLEWDGMELAVKPLAMASSDGTEQARKRFFTKTEAWRDLGVHPHLVAGFYTLEVSGAPRFFMQYVPGKSFAQVLKSMPGPPPLPRAMDLATQIAVAMDFLHARGRAHGGLRSKSCLTVQGDSVLVGPDVGRRTELTPDDAAYSAPEAFRARGEQAKGADVYAFGVILHELLAGARPFATTEECLRMHAGRIPTRLEEALRKERRDEVEILKMFHEDVEPLPPSARGLGTHPTLEALALRCMKKQPQARPEFSEIRKQLVDLFPEVAGSAYRREIPPHDPNEVGENNRAVSYFVMGSAEKAKAILDAWIPRAQAPLSSWLNRKTLAVNAGETEPAALPEQVANLLSHQRTSAGDRHVALFRERLGSRVLDVEARAWTVAISPNGRFVATGSDKPDETARIWDFATGKLLRTLKWTRDNTLSVAFSSDNTRVVTGSDYGAARIWDTTTGTLVRTLEGDWGRVTSVAFLPDGKHVLTGSRDQVARLWEAASGKLVRAFEGHGGPILAIASSPDGRFVVTGSADMYARLWDATSGKPLRALQGHAGPVNGVAFSPDGRFVLTGGGDGLARMWDLAGREVHMYKGHSGAVHAVAFAPGGQFILTGSADRSARMWDVNSAQPVRTFLGHRDAVTSVALSADGVHVATASLDRTVRLWGSTAPRAPNPPWLLYARPVRSTPPPKVEDSPRELLRQLREHDVSVYPTIVAMIAGSPEFQRNSEITRELNASLGPIAVRAKVRDAWTTVSFKTGARVTSVEFEQDCTRVLLAGGHQAQLRSASNGKIVRTFQVPSERIPASVMSPDGRFVVTGSDDKVARVWETASGKLLRALSPHKDRVGAIALSPDGSIVVTGSDDRAIRTWELSTGKLCATITGHQKAVTAVAFSPDGRLVLSGSEDHLAGLWDAASGTPVRVLDGHASRINAVAMSRDGRYVATAGDDRSARLYETATGKPLRLFKLTHDVTSVAFGPDGRLLVTGSDDCVARLWDTTTGEMLRALPHRSYVTAASVARGGGLVLTGADDQFAQIWMVDSEWVFLEDLLTDAEAVLRGGDASVFWPLSASRGGEFEPWLDLWRDLRRCAARRNLAPELTQRFRAARAAVLDKLALIAQGVSPEIPTSMSGQLAHPVYRTSMVDPDLASDLAARLGSDAQSRQPGEAKPSGPEITASRLHPVRLPETSRKAAIRAHVESQNRVDKAPGGALKHLSLSIMGIGPGAALMAGFAGTAGTVMGALFVAGGLWQGVNFVRSLKRQPGAKRR